eukprot:s1117_g3.t1
MHSKKRASNSRIKKGEVSDLEKAEERSDVPTPEEFFKTYSTADGGFGRPVIFRGAASRWKAIDWTNDDDLLRRFGSERVTGVEHNLKETRAGGQVDGMETFRDFLKAYNNSDIYMVSSVPKKMMKEVEFLPCMTCGGYLNFLDTHNFWMGRGGSKSVVLSLLEDFRASGREVDSICWTAAISSCGAAEQWQVAVALLQELISLKLADQVSWSAAISACDKAKKWPMALALLRSMRGAKLHTDTISYNAAISACGGDALCVAEALFEEMRVATAKPSIVTLGAVMSAREKGGKWEEALDLVGELHQRKEELSGVILGAAISACARGEQWELALQMLWGASMKQNLVVYNTAINACAKGGQWQAALCLLDVAAASRLTPNLISFTSSISATEESSAWSVALALLASAGRACSAAEQDAGLRSAAMRSCAAAGRWQDCLILLGLGHRRNVLLVNTAISACAKGHQWEMAVALLGDMEQLQMAPDLVSYSAAITAAEKSGGNWQVAEALLWSMRAAKLQLDGIGYDALQRAFEVAELDLRHRRLQLASPPQIRCGGTMRGPPRLHFCIFQGDAEGASGWTLQQGSLQNRWDVILDGLLKSVMMDGEWPRDIFASAFVGADAVHISGAVQEQVMPIVGYKDGKAQYQPATFKAFEETLWRSLHSSPSSPSLSTGLAWHRDGRGGDCPEVRRRQLDAVDAMLAETAGAKAIAFSTRRAVQYQDLLSRAARSASCEEPETIYLLLGGAHGFDGKDDVDSSHEDALLQRFRAKLGDDNVMSVRLGSSSRVSKFSLANVVSWLRVEDVQGNLQTLARHIGARAEC